jgi:hypothetical protein
MRIAPTKARVLKNPFGHDLLTLGEVSYLTGFSRHGIKKWYVAGKVKRYGTSHRVLLHFDEVMDFLSHPITRRSRLADATR